MFLLLFIIWLICNGRITVEICLIGIVVCAAVFLFTVKFLDYSIKKEWILIRSIPYLAQYVGYLLFEILKANLAVTKLIFRKKKVEPVRVKFCVPLQYQLTRVLFANFITLTPGTITAELNGNEYLVHCLTKEFAEGLTDSKMITILQKIEKL